jgi:predicted protein tyrosine phosphatase
VFDLPNANTYWVLPGRFMAGEYPRDAEEVSSRRKLSEYLRCRVRLFIDLTEQGESGLQPYEPMLRSLADEMEVDVNYVRCPITDCSVPDEATMTDILDRIDAALSEDKTVYVHCWGGVGRTGTVVATHLVRRGMRAQGALEQLARWWSTVEKNSRHPSSPENSLQVQFVRSWENRK